MRTSRISQETSKIIAPSPRRSTRATSSRFSSNVSPPNLDEALDSPTDIEDAIPLPSKKRKLSSAPRTPIKHSPKAGVTIKTELEETLSIAPTKTSRVRKPARKIKNEETGEVEIQPPNDWAEVYQIVKEMRTTGPAQNAAVDTMGCERLGDTAPSPRDKRYHTLTALMLSSQTKDTSNAVAMSRLINELPPHPPGAPQGLNLENILAVDPKLLNELIWAVGFHNNKTRYIKAAAEILRDKYAGDIPDTIEGLMELPGVGPKMAYLCLSSAWGRTEGIGVDVHVHRITNLWGWHGKQTKGPEDTRLALQAWLPKDKWREINWLLVGFGQTVCTPVGRRCGVCEVGMRGLCKSADRAKVTAGRKIKETEVKQDVHGEVVEEEKVKVEAAEEVVAVPKPDGEIHPEAVFLKEVDAEQEVKSESLK